MNTTPDERIDSTIENFIEKGAEIEHTRWSKWQKYFFSRCGIDDSGLSFVTLTLSKADYERWVRQTETSYAELSLSEKLSDRKEVESYIPLLAAYRTEIRKESENEITELKEALIWCSGSSDFQYPNGIAREGYEKIVLPLLTKDIASLTK